MQTCLRYLFLLLLVALGTSLHAQRYLTEYDSTLFVRDTLRTLLKRYENLHFSGYIQPQFQHAESKGIETYAGPNFRPLVDNRFILRRARVKMDYRMPGKNGSAPAAVFTFQFEATERDVNVRDVFVRIFEPRRHNLSLSAGLFARPFGYEVNLSSSFRETPERGRASQILMPSERDLGVMLSWESIKKNIVLPFRFDVGIFNGQGKSGPAEFDSYKDLISRFTLKPISLSPTFTASGGLSLLYGGWAQATRYRYEMGTKDGDAVFLVDSSLSNIGAKAPRHYYGGDVQLIQEHGWGKTEIRAEYWWGTQPGTSETTVNPGELPEGPTYIRNFDAAFFYFLQNIGNPSWELMAKYDWYDPNRRVSGGAIGTNGFGLTEADIKYRTLGLGLTHYFNDKLKVLAYYDIVRNEATSINGFTRDLKDNVFTLRMQMRF